MMNFIRSAYVPLVSVIVIFIIIAVGIIFGMQHERHICNRVVFLEGELGRDAKYVEYLGHGNITRIHYCDGKIEEMPTSRIVKVVDK